MLVLPDSMPAIQPRMTILWCIHLIGVTSLQLLRNDMLDVDNPDLSSLFLQAKAKLTYALAVSELPNICRDTLTFSSQMSNETAKMDQKQYLANCNPVLMAFLHGLRGDPWLCDEAQERELPPLTPEKPSDTYRLVKTTVACTALTKQICIFPYHFRKNILTYNLTCSRTVVDLLGTCSPSGSYQSLKTFLSSLSNASPEVPNNSDLLAVFDNNQILQRRLENYSR